MSSTGRGAKRLPSRAWEAGVGERPECVGVDARLLVRGGDCQGGGTGCREEVCVPSGKGEGGLVSLSAPVEGGR